MKKTFIITEGESDKLLLTALLRLPQEATIVSAGGRSSADALARSYLVNGDNNVAFVLDADTLDHHQLEERRQFYHQSLKQVALRSKWRVVMMVPEIEVLFFRKPSVLESLVGRTITEEEIIQGRFNPKQTLTRLFSNQGIIRIYKTVLANPAVEQLREQPEIKELQQFLGSVPQKAAA